MITNPLQVHFDNFIKCTYSQPPGEAQRKDLQRAFFGGAKVVMDATTPPQSPKHAAFFMVAVINELDAIKAKLAKDVHSWP